jgi:GH24 family phage-related lysozyme (muramidase)
MSPATRRRLQEVQRTLGSDPDGLLGPDTLTRIEQLINRTARLQIEVAASLQVSRAGIDALIAYEVSSEAYYRRRLRHPVWPGGYSGVTIGIGYDLGYNSAVRIRRDWQGLLADRSLELLVRAAGVRGETARAQATRLRNVQVPFTAAKQVFHQSTLPETARSTRRVYPGIEQLPSDAQAALLSLVYNRGTRMSGASRREMKEIRYRVADGDLAGIAAQLRAMKRLWDRRQLAGLHKRRDAEADMVSAAQRRYTDDELVFL